MQWSDWSSDVCSSDLFHNAGKHCWERLRLKICFRTGTNILAQPLITKPGMVSRPTDLDGFRRLMALKMSESETGGKERDPEDVDEREEEILGEGLLYTN
jgi:hypothetical protein